MDITSLKSGFWGYQKRSVCEYIAKANEEFSSKLMETIKDYDRTIRELNDKISRLEEENAAFREERDRVTKVMTDAKVFSDDLRAKAKAEDKKFRDDNLKYNKDQIRRIDEISEGIDNIRDSIQRLVCSIDGDLSEKQSEVLVFKSKLKSIEEDFGVKNGNEHKKSEDCK